MKILRVLKQNVKFESLKGKLNVASSNCNIGQVAFSVYSQNRNFQQCCFCCVLLHTENASQNVFISLDRQWKTESP